MADFAEWAARVEASRIQNDGTMILSLDGESIVVNGEVSSPGRSQEIMARSLYYETRDNLDAYMAFQVGYIDSIPEDELNNG